MHSPTPFYKFHGAGNDFILIDNRKNIHFEKEDIEFWCHRRTGIGADGFILLETDHADSDFRMRYYNADGLEASLCGNGSRCITAFAHYLKIIDHTCRFRASDGIHLAEVISANENEWEISLQMKDLFCIERFEDGYFADTGSPHFVKFIEEIDTVSVVNEGRKIRHDSRFPEGCNVNFVKFSESCIAVRTYERGVEDETLSCGTGVTAAAIVLSLQQNWPDGEHLVKIKTKGGKLSVKYKKAGTHFSDIYLQGPAVLVFEGVII